MNEIYLTFSWFLKNLFFPDPWEPCLMSKGHSGQSDMPGGKQMILPSGHTSNLGSNAYYKMSKSSIAKVIFSCVSGIHNIIYQVSFFILNFGPYESDIPPTFDLKLII